MNNLIKAADELAGIVRREMAHYDDPECMMAALHAYRTARNEQGEVKVKPLVWECEAGWRWKGVPPDGFFANVAKWVWSDMNGKFKYGGSKELFSTVEEAKRAAQSDYETRIRSALEE